MAERSPLKGLVVGSNPTLDPKEKDMAWYFVLWLVAGLLIMGGVSVYVGLKAERHQMDGEHVVLVLTGTALAIVAFPAILCLGVVAAPFVGLYYLGTYLRNKNASKA